MIRLCFINRGGVQVPPSSEVTVRSDSMKSRVPGVTGDVRREGTDDDR